MRATRRIRGAALTAAAALAALTGCHDAGSDASAPIVRPASTHSTAPEAFPGMTARQILERSITAMKSVSALTVNVRTTVDDDEEMHFTGALTRSGTCAAAAVIGGHHLQVIRDGSYYLKADAGFWKAKGGPHGGDMATALAGKWLKMPKGKQSAGFAELCDLDTMLDGVAGSAEEGTLKRGATLTLHGREVLTLTQTASDGVTDMLVADHGAPYLLRAFTPDDASNDATFSGFGKAPHISPPPARDTIDLSAFGNPDIAV